MNHGETAVVFDCAGDSLVGILHAASGPVATKVGVLIVVGGPQYRVGSHRQFVIMARLLAARGYSVLRFDYRGMGDSAGTVREFAAVDADIRAALDHWTRIDPTLRRVILWGLCDAASAAFMYAPTDTRVGGVVAANPWVRSVDTEARAYVRHYYGRRLLQRDFWAKLFSGNVRLAESLGDFSRKVARSRASNAELGHDVERADFRARMLSGLQDVSVPILLLLSGRDLTAREFEEFSGASPEWRSALSRESVKTIRFAEADHTFSDRTVLGAVTSATMDWISYAKGCAR